MDSTWIPDGCEVNQRNKMDDHCEDRHDPQEDCWQYFTKFIRKTESRVFAYMNTAPAQELNDNYGVLPSGRPDL